MTGPIMGRWDFISAGFISISQVWHKRRNLFNRSAGALNLPDRTGRANLDIYVMSLVVKRPAAARESTLSERSRAKFGEGAPNAVIQELSLFMGEI